MYNKKMCNILWDFDGTLAYREGMWSGTLLSLLNKNGIKNIPNTNSMPIEDCWLLEKMKPYLNTGFTWHNYEYSHIELFCGKTWYEYYANLFYGILINIGIMEKMAKEISEKVIIEYMDKTKWFIYDDVIEALVKVKDNGFKNYILSNHIPKLTEIVENVGLNEYFYGIYSSGNIGYEKPNIKIYEYVLNELKVNKNDCIIIGDSFKADIKGGENIGIKSILVRSENIEKYKWYCKDLGKIIEKIKEIQ
jgi:putative hydrolase of the HAD superfamily